MIPPIAILQHVPHEGPGAIATLAAERGRATVLTRLDLGEPLPSPDAIAGLVVLGGPMGADDAAAHPWIVPERVLVAATLARGVPTLGVCLGAQVLARSQGARVMRGPAQEIGMGSVDITPVAGADPLLGPESPVLECFHWRGDTFDLPAGAVLLAGNAAYPHQAFRIGRGWGLQFHVEVDEGLAADWAPHLPDGATIDVPALEPVGRRVIGAWLDRVEAAGR